VKCGRLNLEKSGRHAHISLLHSTLHIYVLSFNNNNNMLAYKAPVCQKTSV